MNMRKWENIDKEKLNKFEYKIDSKDGELVIIYDYSTGLYGLANVCIKGLNGVIDTLGNVI